jgi:hypothetical protein
VRLAILGKGFVDLGVRLESRGLQACLHHAQAAVREDRPLKWLISLQADDDLVVPVDVAGFMRQQGRGVCSVNGEHAFLSLVGEIGLQLCPYGLGAR